MLRLAAVECEREPSYLRNYLAERAVSYQCWAPLDFVWTANDAHDELLIVVRGT